MSKTIKLLCSVGALLLVFCVARIAHVYAQEGSTYTPPTTNPTTSITQCLSGQRVKIPPLRNTSNGTMIAAASSPTSPT